MLRILTGDLFDSDAQVLTNAVNCAGVMGKGIALEFKRRFPDMYKDYTQRCRAGKTKLGEPYVYRQPSPPHVLNFPTKGHWRDRSELPVIVAGLECLARYYQEWGIESLAVPALGCGLGGLEWRVVGPMLCRHLGLLDIPIDLYAPPGTPADQLELSLLYDTANGKLDERRADKQ